MLRKKRLTKQVWFDNLLWKVREIISPNKRQDFLILERVNVESVFEEHDNPTEITYATEMACVDCHNDIWYPNTKAVREALKSEAENASQLEEIKERSRTILNRAWLDAVVIDW